MVFEFDYVPLAIGLINQYAPGAAPDQTQSDLPPTPPAVVLASQIVPRLDLNAAIPVWNQDERTWQNERESPLLRLPAELKLKIWAMAYEDVAIHITCKDDGRIGHFICDENRNGFYHNENTPPVADAQYLQCRCRGTLLEPPYKDAPDAEDVKRRRESTASCNGRERIGGMLLACREIYANARDYLWTQPTFIFPTQRLLPRFAASIAPSLLSQIARVTLHTYSESWRHMSPSGFFGGSSDHGAPAEWAAARSVIAHSMPGLKDFHLIAHIAGGDSTIWYDDCKPAGCVRAISEDLRKAGRNIVGSWREDTMDPDSDQDEDAIVGPLDLPAAQNIDTNPNNQNGEDVLAIEPIYNSRRTLVTSGLRCMVTAAVEGSRHGPGVTGSWVTREQVKGMHMTGQRSRLPERNIEILRELELEMPEGWKMSWWVSVEEREGGAVEAGPKPWPFNHMPFA